MLVVRNEDRRKGQKMQPNFSLFFWFDKRIILILPTKIINPQGKIVFLILYNVEINKSSIPE